MEQCALVGTSVSRASSAYCYPWLPITRDMRNVVGAYGLPYYPEERTCLLRLFALRQFGY